MAWDKTKPSGSDDIRQGDNVIRDHKAALETAFTSSGHFPINAASPKYQYVPETGTTANRPTNGEGGFYYDTETEELLRDNGTSWDAIGCNFATGTYAVFYQAAAPTGWTIHASHASLDDRLFRGENTSSGTTGGSWSASSSSTSASHTHNLCTFYRNASTFDDAIKIWVDTYGSGDYILFGEHDSLTKSTSGGSGRESATWASSGISNGDVGISSSQAWSHSHTVSHALSDHAIARAIVCLKD